MVKRVRYGFLVDEDSLAVDVIEHAMRNTRNFMSEPHTRKYLRSGEVWQGRLGIQEIGWDQWQAAGSPDILSRAQAIAEKILVTHQVEPLDDAQSRGLDEIMQHAVQILEEDQ
jgi:trimethylamine--corrinoid protein Co-methyltransferase